MQLGLVSNKISTYLLMISKRSSWRQANGTGDAAAKTAAAKTAGKCSVAGRSAEHRRAQRAAGWRPPQPCAAPRVDVLQPCSRRLLWSADTCSLQASAVHIAKQRCCECSNAGRNTADNISPRATARSLAMRGPGMGLLLVLSLANFWQNSAMAVEISLRYICMQRCRNHISSRSCTAWRPAILLFCI